MTRLSLPASNLHESTTRSRSSLNAPSHIDRSSHAQYLTQRRAETSLRTSQPARQNDTRSIMGVFTEQFAQLAYPYEYQGQLKVGVIAGGVPTDPHIAEGWIRSKLATTDDIIVALVAETMIARGIAAPSDDEAPNEPEPGLIEAVAAMKTLCGFKRDRDRGGELYYEGRQLKAAMKEAVSVAMSAGKIQKTKWGETGKWITRFFPEHVFVVEDNIYMGVKEHTGIVQRFITTAMGKRALQYNEYVTDVFLDFTVVTDWEFSEKDWAMIWLTGEQQGVGAARSAGFGRYEVTKWERVR